MRESLRYYLLHLGRLFFWLALFVVVAGSLVDTLVEDSGPNPVEIAQ